MREIQLSEDLGDQYDRLARDLGGRALAGLLAVAGSALLLLGGAVVGAVAVPTLRLEASEATRWFVCVPEEPVEWSVSKKYCPS